MLSVRFFIDLISNKPIVPITISLSTRKVESFGLVRFRVIFSAPVRDYTSALLKQKTVKLRAKLLEKK
jgi:hypothetical protein